MTSQIPSQSSFSLQLRDRIEYPEGGVVSKVIHKDDQCDHTLFCLAADTSISEHTSPRNATINVIEGKGLFTLEGKEIQLEPGVFISMEANAPHALKAEQNLAFLLTLWKKE
ncbi:Cupin domain protein [Coleofasciculus chthonoplastes PCC 7420]|uniref:Cupin domain protein n=1 Tax=Coleofasciculus chthonoplastes PCC 7420 TaxID=118168 RepID=B4VRT6_9CYAN|nr:cupin domain-containing protein [Coleofasciculus chthonoplastes]EDX75533.1 Cupin domain protein [Coleofasciculus chthonoplastes PCC 7420]